MKKKNIVVVIILIIIVAVLMFGAVKLMSNNINENGKVSKIDDEIYLNVVKNTEKNGELTLNSNENTKYYYFDIINYNEQEEKFNQINLTPYIKIVFNNNDEKKFIDWKLYYLENETDSEELWTEITEKGETEGSFAQYYKCMPLGAYNFDNLEKNIGHYALKMVLNTENEEFTNLEDNLTENFSIVLGYREIK